MGDSIKVAKARLTKIAVLKTHIINYAKTREVYTAYRKTGYSKAFLEAHREENTLHKAAKDAFDEAGLQKLPKVKVLDLGDITKVDGGKIPPVHVITFGSPCQNLSLIGNRSGLAGAKSSLFYQAFRIIQEMRDATDNLYPAIVGML